jgi:vacuole morphology and inheritance protein 14
VLIKDPFIRQLVVSWISVLDSVPDLNLLDYLPEFLGGLFLMLSAEQKDIRQQADVCLADFLREITEVVNVDFGPMVVILVDQCQSPDKPAIWYATPCHFVSALFSFNPLTHVNLTLSAAA